jgi:hypothetical protein
MRLSQYAFEALLAQQLFIAKEYRDFVVREFEKIEKEIIDTGKYHYDESYYLFEDCDLPEDRIIRDRSDLMLISGLKQLDEPEYKDTDADRYYLELRYRALSEGFIDGENARAIAENDIMKLEDKLISQTKSIHKILLENIVMLEHRKELIDALLNLFKAVTSDKNYEAIKNRYFDVRINRNFQKTRYHDGQPVEVLCYCSKEKQNKWEKGMIIKTVPANDRAFRVEVKLHNGFLYTDDKAVAPECLRPL